MNNSALTVTQLNTYVKSLFDSDVNLRSVFVFGEISNFNFHMKSGHLYFSIKDENSSVRCVMFKTDAVGLRFVPRDGMKVSVRGKVSVFPRDGQYQIYVTQMIPEGLGEVYLSFLRLKETLGAEGLFDEARKKPIPEMPKSIGIATSPTGAALQDILNISSRRFPMADIIIYPCTVQGSDAAESVCKAVRFFNRNRNADVIIVARGGGSYEDLAAFNDEALARCVANSAIPVVSAVGHETDFTIIDFVSDLRAPTPSAAAEIVCPDSKQISQYVDRLFTQIYQDMYDTYSHLQQRLSDALQHLDLSRYLQIKELLYDAALKKFNSSAEKLYEAKKNGFLVAASKLESLNPMSVLLRGYSVAYKNGSVIRSVNDVETGDKVNIKMRDGVINCVTEETRADV